MKAFLTTIAILTAVVFTAAPSHASDSPGVLARYNLPIGASKLKMGHAVTVVASESFQAALKTLNDRLATLPEDKRRAIVEKFDLTIVPAYSADLWANKASYEAYKKALRETTIQPTQEVLISLQPLGNDEWRLNSATVDQSKKVAPLTIGALRYNARTNVWVSLNGELQANPYSTTEDCMYGAQTGTEWSLDKTDDFSKVVEKIRFTTTADGKYIYISYDFQETSKVSGTVLARGSYVLRFPTASK